MQPLQLLKRFARDVVDAFRGLMRDFALIVLVGFGLHLPPAQAASSTAPYVALAAVSFGFAVLLATLFFAELARRSMEKKASRDAFEAERRRECEEDWLHCTQAWYEESERERLSRDDRPCRGCGTCAYRDFDGLEVPCKNCHSDDRLPLWWPTPC